MLSFVSNKMAKIQILNHLKYHVRAIQQIASFKKMLPVCTKIKIESGRHQALRKAVPKKNS